MSTERTRAQATKRAEELEDLRRVLSVIFSMPDLTLRSVYDAKNKRIKKTFKERDLHEVTIPKLFVSGESRVRIGGGGIVIGCYRKLSTRTGPLNRIYYALKIARPSLFRKDKKFGETLAEQGRTASEFTKHAPLSHRNICRVFDAAFVGVPDDDTDGNIPCPTMLLEWIRSPKSLTEYLADPSLTYNHIAIVDLLTQTFEGLAALHEQKLVHWDMKADNVLVDEMGVVKVTDLGNARHIGIYNSSEIAQSTRVNLPPSVRKMVAPVSAGELAASKRTNVPVGHQSNLDCVWLDLWMLAYELDRLFLTVPEWKGERVRDRDDPFDRNGAEAFLGLRFPKDNEDAQLVLEGLRVILRRLLRPENPGDDLFYQSAAEVVSDLGKLLPEFGVGQHTPELRAVPQHVLRLPWTRNGVFTPRVAAIFNSPLMTRVSQHNQLSTLKHVYPGAEHKRSEHIAGVLNTVIHYIRALYADRTESFWRLSMEAKDIDALLLAALLHDMGHIAFGHYLEELTSMFDGRMHEDYIVDILDPARKGRFGPHGQTSIFADRKVLRDIVSKEWRYGPATDDLFREVAAILAPPSDVMDSEVVLQESSILHRSSCEILKQQVLHSIMDAAIDADKLDYLIRDAIHCGVEYAKSIDLDRYFQSVTVLRYLPRTAISADEKGDREYITAKRVACVAISEKGILPVESTLVARYQMFSAVYWHRTARAETAMLQYLVQRFAALGKQGEAEERLDKLIDVFRRKDDTSALIWLRMQFRRPGVRLTQTEKTVVQRMCNALLGSREDLYWPGFEMQYRGPGAGVIERFKRDDARILHEKLVGYWEQYWGDIHSEQTPKKMLSAAAAIRHWETVRTRFARGLAEKLNLPHLGCEPGEVLIDLPPRGKDQIRNIYVVGGIGTRIIQQSSPIADAVSDAFRYWTRRIRVFLSPAVWQRMTVGGISSEKVRDACHSVMDEIVNESNDDLFRWVDAARKHREKRRARVNLSHRRGSL